LQAGSPAAAQPGSKAMPAWGIGELPDAPEFTWRSWTTLIGPGLVLGGASIGGGEWLTGPRVSALYGGALLWLATLSIVFQVIYNLEISRYTLYTGEPILTGKFRVHPGPMFWLFVYLLLDFGSVFPYLAANAATPLAAVILGRLPGPGDARLLGALGYIVFLAILVPLLVGGKVYNSLKALMSFKVFAVLGFLSFLALFYSTPTTWFEILSGFLKFGTLPVQGEGLPRGSTDNALLAWLQGRPFPALDLSMLGYITAMAAISGSGGLTNTQVSGYTRDQGWGMGRHVGAIPSVIGGQQLQLAHVGMVFEVSAESVRRFRRWYRHVMRDQLAVWMPACFLGLALPSMLSIQFLQRGTEVPEAAVAAMTADGVARAVGGGLGPLFWYLTIFCGFLVLAPSAVTTADGVLRRWVDVLWTASPALRRLEPHRIRNVYFATLLAYACFGLISLWMGRPEKLLLWATTIYNFALGFSCWHVLAVNLILLPKEIRPGWGIRIALVLSGMFFFALGTVVTLRNFGYI
jgi:hypothetical protein